MAKYDHIDFKPPQGVQDEAKLGLKLRAEYGRGGTEVGVARARDLSNGRTISPETARRMKSYFARHEVDKEGQGWERGDEGWPSAGRIAFLLWGGSSGEAWSNKLVDQMDAADEAKAMVNEIKLFGPIGDGFNGASDIKSQLADMDQKLPLIVRIDSPGGSVFTGFSIFQAFKSYAGPKRAIIESAAFSIASYIAMAFDEIEIAPNGYLMIHNPSVMTEGDDEKHAADALLLTKLKESMIDAYAQRTGIEKEEIRQMLKDETYLNAEEAKELGFVTRVLGGEVKSKIEASNDVLPLAVVASLFGSGVSLSHTSQESKPMADDKVVAASVREIKAAFPGMSDSFVLSCIELELPMASVAVAATEEMQKANEELVQSNEELKQELEAMKEKLAMYELKEEEQSAQEEEEKEEEEMAKARARSHDPIANSLASLPKRGTAIERWSEAVASYKEKGLDSQQAVLKAHQANPGLRVQYLAELNG